MMRYGDGDDTRKDAKVFDMVWHQRVWEETHQISSRSWRTLRLSVDNTLRLGVTRITKELSRCEKQ